VSRKLVALKQVKLPPPDANIDAFRTRVSCVLKDIEVMNHAPLASHQNIIHLLGYGWNRQGSIPFLITECAQHGTMRQLLQGTSLRARQKHKLCRNVAAALLELHLCGIAHGDVKLDNVLVVLASGDELDHVTLDDDTVVIAKLADFGHCVLLNPGEVVNADASQEYRGTLA
jgi:serine/threonine protein kinase